MILAKVIKNNQSDTICDAWKYLHNILKSEGSALNLYIMDNELYDDMKEATKQYEISYQLSPPHMHLWNSE